MGLFSLLTGGVREKYEAVQQLANQLSPDEAVYCHSIALMQLSTYLENPSDPSASIYSRAAYVEAVVALYERLQGTDPWFSTNKGVNRVALTKAVLRDFSGQYSTEIRGQLRKFDFDGGDREWSMSDEERLGWHIQEMLSAGP